MRGGCGERRRGEKEKRKGGEEDDEEEEEVSSEVVEKAETKIVARLPFSPNRKGLDGALDCLCFFLFHDHQRATLSMDDAEAWESKERACLKRARRGD